MKNVKKLIAVALCAVMVLVAFAGCSSKSNTYKVGICQLVQHEALDAATKGFKEALVAKLGDKVEFDYQNAAGDSATCATIANNFVAGGYDLIMANATPALQAAVAATTSVPIVATSITDYATALEISDWKGTTGMNVTGTSDLAPLSEQAAMIKELFPNVKKVGILYCSAEANSVYQAKVIAEELKKASIPSKAYTCSDSNDVAAATTSACADCDVIYIPTDNTMASCTETVNAVAEAAKVPIIAGEENICRGCGVATLSINYYDIGYAAGEMAAQILTEGKDPATMEIQSAPKVTKEYNKTLCDALSVKIPEGYTEVPPAAE